MSKLTAGEICRSQSCSVPRPFRHLLTFPEFILSVSTFHSYRDRLSGQDNKMPWAQPFNQFPLEMPNTQQNGQYVATTILSPGPILCQSSSWNQQQNPHGNRNCRWSTSQQWNMPLISKSPLLATLELELLLHDVTDDTGVFYKFFYTNQAPCFVYDILTWSLLAFHFVIVTVVINFSILK